MAKHCETFEHTADLGLQGRADSLAELFEAMGEALGEQICPARSVRARRTRALEVAADGAELLLADFLRELLSLFHLEKFLIARVRVRACDETAVAAEVAGETYDPARHELGAEIKAVTYHQLRVGREGGGWTGRVVLDI